MMTLKIIAYNDKTGESEAFNIPIDLLDDIEELPMFTFKEMNVFTNTEVIYMDAPTKPEQIIYN